MTEQNGFGLSYVIKSIKDDISRLEKACDNQNSDRTRIEAELIQLRSDLRLLEAELHSHLARLTENRQQRGTIWGGLVVHLVWALIVGLSLFIYAVWMKLNAAA